MIIRRLEPTDLEQSYNLLNELYENKIQYDIFAEKYVNCLNDNNFYGIIAEENDEIQGVLIARLMNRLVKSGDILFIDDLIVHKDYRSNGIGKVLVKNAIDYAKEKGCETVELTCYIAHENACRFYENNGFKKQHYKFKQFLD